MAAKQRKEAPPVPPAPPASTELTSPIDLLEQSLAEMEVAAIELGEELSNVLLKEVGLRAAQDDGENDNRSVVGRRLYYLDLRARGITELLTDLRKALDLSIL